MEKIKFGRRVGTTIYHTGMVARALSSQTFVEKGFDLTPEQFLILDLVQEKGELYQRQICEITLKDRSNVARLIKILEEKSLIQREQSSNGRRIYKITATEKGKEVRDAIKPTALEVRHLLMNGITQEDLKITLATLNKVYENARPLVKLQI
mgnify:CR=1 FL=1